MDTDQVTYFVPRMSFLEAVKACFKKYATFRGRARRSEYWWFYLFTALGGLVSTVLDSLFVNNTLFPVFGIILNLAVILPSLAVSVRRLHDTNRSGWYILLPFAGAVVFVASIAITGAAATASGIELGGGTGAIIVIFGVLLMLGFSIYLLYLFIKDSDPGPNRFGPSPKYPASV